MGLYIKGMEMPTNCPCELLGIGYDLYCSFASGIPARVKEYYECCQNGTRPSWCHLVPVAPHGRLIDADALKVSLAFAEKTAEWAVPALRAVLMVIDEMPTIIPAEPAEEGET